MNSRKLRNTLERALSTFISWNTVKYKFCVMFWSERHVYQQWQLTSRLQCLCLSNAMILRWQDFEEVTRRPLSSLMGSVPCERATWGPAQLSTLLSLSGEDTVLSLEDAARWRHLESRTALTRHWICWFVDLGFQASRKVKEKLLQITQPGAFCYSSLNGLWD